MGLLGILVGLALLVWFAYKGWSVLLLALAGGRNVFGTAAARYPEVGDGEIASASPDVVLLTTEPFPFAPKHVEELAAETGIARERFRIVDGERLSWHGSRTAAGIDYAARVLRD